MNSDATLCVGDGHNPHWTGKWCTTCGRNLTEQSVISPTVTRKKEEMMAAVFGSSTPAVSSTDLRRIAQYFLAAAVALQNGQLDRDAEGLLHEWCRASDHLRSLLQEFNNSTAATATKRAIGMLTRPQLARDEAAEECAALLTNDEPLKNALADGRWDEAGEQIAAAVIHRYLMALERGQE